MLLLASSCGGGGGGATDGAPVDDATTTIGLTGPLRQEQFHEELVLSIRIHFGTLIPERFTIDEDSIQMVDVTVGEIEFKSRRDFGEFAQQNGWLGFGSADFTASGGVEFWGLITHVFQAPEGARATFERFQDAESVTVDGTRIDSQSQPYSGGGAVGSLTVETYEESAEGIDPVRFVVLRGSLLDDNVIHYVTGVLDLPVDGFGELQRVMRGLEGGYRELFRQFLQAGGVDAPTTTTTRDPTFVPADEGSPEGGLPGDG